MRTWTKIGLAAAALVAAPVVLNHFLRFDLIVDFIPEDEDPPWLPPPEVEDGQTFMWMLNSDGMRQVIAIAQAEDDVEMALFAVLAHTHIEEDEEDFGPIGDDDEG